MQVAKFFIMTYFLPSMEYSLLHEIHVSTHGLDVQKEDMVNSEALMLEEEDGIDVELIDIEIDEEDKGKVDNIEILRARPREPRLE